MHLKLISALLSGALMLSCTSNQNQEPPSPPEATTAPEIRTLTETHAPVFTPSTLPYPFSSAVQVGDILFLSGEIGDAGDGSGPVPGGLEPETHQMFKRIESTLAQHGLGFEDVFKCTVMLADMSEWQQFNEIYATYFKSGKYPTRSAMGVNGLAFGARVEMECWAYRPQGR